MVGPGRPPAGGYLPLSLFGYGDGAGTLPVDGTQLRVTTRDLPGPAVPAPPRSPCSGWACSPPLAGGSAAARGDTRCGNVTP